MKADNVVVGPGSKQLMYLVQLVLDVVTIVPTPAWVSYVPQARLASRPCVTGPAAGAWDASSCRTRSAASATPATDAHNPERRPQLVRRAQGPRAHGPVAMIGTSLGPYQIIEQLGAGGMGEVYLGEDTRLGRKVAIKVLPAEM